MSSQTTNIDDGLKKMPIVRDDEKIAPIVMDTVRPAGRTVGMESGTGAGEREGDALQNESGKQCGSEGKGSVSMPKKR